MTVTEPKGYYFPVDKSGLFSFKLEPYDIQRNLELEHAFKNCLNPSSPSSPQDTFVILGGLYLPVKSFTPKQTKYEIKTRNWLSRALLGLQNERRTVRHNRDGSTTTIVERTLTRRDGTKVTTTEEKTTGIPFVSSTTKRRELTDQNNVGQFETLTQFPVNATDGSNNLNPPALRQDPSHYNLKKTKTVTTPPDREIEYIHEKQELEFPQAGGDVSDGKHQTYQGAATIRNKVSEYRYVHNKEPLRLAKPVTLVSITGKVINQFLVPQPPQGVDRTWWNDNMGNAETQVPALGYPPLDTLGYNGVKVETVTYTKNLGDGTVEEKTDTTTTNADGEVTIESVSVIKPLGDLYTPETFQTTTKEPLKTTVEKKYYDKDGVHVRTESTITSSLHRDTNALPPLTEVISEVEDERGKKTKVTTKRWKDGSGKDYEDVVEEIMEMGKHVSTKSISEQIDHETKIKTINTSTTITDSLGNSYTEDESRKEFIGDTVSTSEEITEEFDDLVLNEMVIGSLITEYQISGEFMTADQAYRFLNKHAQHQNAWAMYELLNTQLDLGERISPKILNELFRQQIKVFTGEVTPGVNGDGTHYKVLGSRGGNVLDRIAFVGFVDKLDLSEGVVFAPGPDSFKIEWIDGTDKIFSWSMTLHKYDNLVKGSDDLTFDLPNSPWDVTDVIPANKGIYDKLNIGNTLNGI